MTQKQILTFIAFMLECRKVKSTTVSKTLSAIRTLHLIEGVDLPQLRCDRVKSILKGQANWDEEIKRNSRNVRLPVTLNVLKLLKVQLRRSKLDIKKKALIWSVSLLAFNGCLRIGEVLSKHPRVIDPENTLLKKDIWLHSKRIDGKKVEVISLRLKSTKESRVMTRGTVIEIYANKTDFCAVSAYKAYLELTKKASFDSAAFRHGLGWAYECREFNSDLKQLLQEFLPYGQISGHSFRSGMATLLAQCGYSEDIIQAVGRWSSTAFKTYIKLPALTRVRVASKLAGLMS